ncbi:MAG: hypothetical protein N2489_09080 [Clostridia bacterium]|nr:hypothetical protein [Clostridia bacterium]
MQLFQLSGMNKFKILSLAICVVVFLSLFTSYSFAEKKVIRLCYFYVNTCDECREAEDRIDHYISLITKKSPQFEFGFYSYNISQREGLELMQEYCHVYGVPDDANRVPLLFVGRQYFQGEENIEKGLNELGKQLDTGIIPELLVANHSQKGADIIMQSFNSLKLASVCAAGLINGLNPCSLSMLLFLLSLLIVKKDMKILSIGMIFIFAKLITYIFLGTVLYEFLKVIDMNLYSLVMKLVMGVFISFTAYLNIRDYFSAKKEKYGEIKNQLPSLLRKFNHTIISKTKLINGQLGLSVAAGILGIVVSIGEFLCTGQVYLATIIYFVQAEGNFNLSAFAYLTIYSLSFIIPSLFILLVLVRTKRLMELSEALRKRLPIIKLATAFVLIAVGGYVIILT